MDQIKRLGPVVRHTLKTPQARPGSAEPRRRAAPPRSPDADANNRRITGSSTSSGGLALNQRIFHQKFGYGRITAIEGSKLTVVFEKAGVKKVVETFVERV